jgi:glycosyltransferase involved in cell wall biosynthesis
VNSLGEFTVARDQVVRPRTGWFSDRSASYLAAGRPVITQDTGFAEVLPTGEGLFAFSTVEEAVEAVAQVAANPGRHGAAARLIANEYFSAEIVLRDLLARVGW